MSAPPLRKRAALTTWGVRSLLGRLLAVVAEYSVVHSLLSQPSVKARLTYQDSSTNLATESG